MTITQTIPSFATDTANILSRLNSIDPLEYGRSRNYVNGAVTYLSPYLSRGVLSTRQVLEHVLARGYRWQEVQPLVQELCWRDYFQRVAQVKDVNTAIRQEQANVAHHGVPAAVAGAYTGINAIDDAIRGLYRTGYMHNHLRMYTAAVVCNTAHAHWLHPARWLYYHLLDGDWASNACSWQWVAGANSSKVYRANQENINRYTLTTQQGTWLDVPYETLPQLQPPAHLLDTKQPALHTTLPQLPPPDINPQLPAFIYDYYNLDPLWHTQQAGNRILLLEPQVFALYPVSERCLAFALALGGNIPNLQVYVGSFASLCAQYAFPQVYYKEHPFHTGYTGIEEPRDWIAPTVSGYYPSFFAYWKKVATYLEQQYP